MYAPKEQITVELEDESKLIKTPELKIEGQVLSKTSELNVEENRFYILIRMRDGDREIRLYSQITPAVARIKNYLEKGEEVNQIELMLVKISDEELEVEGVPWSIIAKQLVVTVESPSAVEPPSV